MLWSAAAWRRFGIFLSSHPLNENTNKAATRHRTPKMSYVNISGLRLEYEWHGQHSSELPTIVFLHEGLGCVEMWRDFPQCVAAATELPVLVYSRAGYGKSSPVELPRDVNYMHHEALVVLPELLDKFNIEKAVLLGHSDGASIALIYAGTEKDSRVQALILEAPHVFVEDVSTQSVAVAVEKYEQLDLRERLERYHGKNVECAFRGWSEIWLNPAFRSWNIEEFLAQITVPVMLVQCEDDPYGTSLQLDAIARGCNGDVSLIILPNCGHRPHRHQPDRTLEAVTNFIRTHVSPK
jgi:pimeloyl-ACP methyl ester carboxylesterase